MRRQSNENNQRINKAQNIILNERGVDYILNAVATPNFVEITASMGGDILCFRVYDDGSIYAR